MFKISGNTITVTRGDSGRFTVTPKSGGMPRILSEGEQVRIYVSLLPGGVPVIEKSADAQDENGRLTFRLESPDTDIPRSTYVFEAKLFSADKSEVCTFIGGDREKVRFQVV